MAQDKNNAFKQILSQLIADVFEKEGNKPLNYKQVSGKLNITDGEARQAIQNILKDESKAGNFKEVEKGKYILKELKAVIMGRVDMTADGSAFVIPDDEFEDDIYIAPRKLRNALHGDKVKVHAYSKSRGRRKEGEVVEVLERARTEYTGTINISPRFAFFTADDRKMLSDIFVPLSDLNNAQDGEKVLVEITEWPQDGKNKNPVGKVTYVLGKKGENDTEMNAILADFGFPLSFPKAVEQEAEAYDGSIPADEIAKRRDFRQTTTFTIDPADAKDFDDAL